MLYDHTTRKNRRHVRLEVPHSLGMDIYLMSHSHKTDAA